MGILISNKCEVPGCDIPRQKHSPKQRAICSRKRQKMREAGLLSDEKISIPPAIYKTTPSIIRCKRYSE